MAINELGISPNEQGVIGTSKRIAASDGTVSETVRFETQSNGWTSANIWITAYGIEKAGNESINGYQLLGTVGDSGIPLSSFTLVSGSVGDGYIWDWGFANVSGLLSLIGDLDYANRDFDALRLTIQVRVYWGSSINESERQVVDCFIGFIPDYTLSSIYYDANGLNIDYTANNWNRPNDRWAVTNIYDGENLVIADSRLYGTVGSYGTITIPKDKLSYIPTTGDTLTGSIRFVGSWMGTGLTLNTLDLSTVTVTNLYNTKTPTLTLSASSEGVTATVGQTGTGSNLDYVEVSMVGSEFGLDRAQISLGESHLFRAVPYGVETEWQAVGYSSAAGELAMSNAVTETAQAVEQTHKAATFTNDDGDVFIAYNASYTSQSAPEAKTVKFAGRKRQTVGFGEGGRTDWTVTGVAQSKWSDLIVTDEKTLRSLPEKGIYIMRLPNGTRAQVYITNCNISRVVDDVFNVTINASEVS